MVRNMLLGGIPLLVLVILGSTGVLGDLFSRLTESRVERIR